MSSKPQEQKLVDGVEKQASAPGAQKLTFGDEKHDLGAKNRVPHAEKPVSTAGKSVPKTEKHIPKSPTLIPKALKPLPNYKKVLPKAVQNKGSVDKLPHRVIPFVRHWIHLCKPGGVYICDGSDGEGDDVIKPWVDAGNVKRLGTHNSSLLFRSHPRDTGSALESNTYFCTSNKEEWFPSSSDDDAANVGLWKSLEDIKEAMDERFVSSMSGRTMYVFPFCLGHVESKWRKLGVMITDSPFVYLEMRMVVRVLPGLWKLLSKADVFYKCVHSMGCPRPVKELVKHHWPCNPEHALLAYFPEDQKIKTYGTGMLTPSTWLFPMASVTARREGWLVSRLTILSVTVPKGQEFFIAIAFAKGCGTSTLAKIESSLPGYNIRILGTGMTWLWASNEGVLRAVNPLVGFSGLANRINNIENPEMMVALQSNAMFLNTANTTNGNFYWDSMGKEKNVEIIDWRGHPLSTTTDGDHAMAAHPDSRYYLPTSKLPFLHPLWDHPDGVPISAIIFGGKRKTGVPLVYECKSWTHGVLMGACLRTEVVTSTDRTVIHDPMAASECIVDSSLGLYLQQWLELEHSCYEHTVRFFHVNWFRDIDDDGHVIWPGMEENVRVLDWILRYCDYQGNISVRRPFGHVPRPGSINMTGLESVKLDDLLSVPKHFWIEEIREARAFLEQKVGKDAPAILFDLLDQEEEGFKLLPDHELPCAPCCNQIPNRCYVCLRPPSKLKTCHCSK